MCVVYQTGWPSAFCTTEKDKKNSLRRGSMDSWWGVFYSGINHPDLCFIILRTKDFLVNSLTAHSMLRRSGISVQYKRRNGKAEHCCHLSRNKEIGSSSNGHLKTKEDVGLPPYCCK